MYGDLLYIRSRIGQEHRHVYGSGQSVQASGFQSSAVLGPWKTCKKNKLTQHIAQKSPQKDYGSLDTYILYIFKLYSPKKQMGIKFYKKASAAFCITGVL